MYGPVEPGEVRVGGEGPRGTTHQSSARGHPTCFHAADKPPIPYLLRFPYQEAEAFAQESPFLQIK